MALLHASALVDTSFNLLSLPLTDGKAYSSTPTCELQEAVLCVPTDRRMPKLRVRSSQVSRLLGQRFVVRCTGWEQSSMYPSAHVLRILGPLNNLRYFQIIWKDTHYETH